MFRAGKRATGPAGVPLFWEFVVLGACVATAARAAVPPAAAPGLFGGGLAWSDSLDANWARCDEWVYPVGDSLDAGRDPADGSPRFRMTRGLIREHGRHDGADLSNRGSGDVVRAAASGVVIHADTTSATHYGVHAVIGHRLADGGMVVSVYAHLQSASLQVATGDPVRAGQAIGRVGDTGRASSPHLHFEVRRPRTLTESWMRSRPVDPMPFVAARLPGPADPDWSNVYLAWAEAAGLVSRGRGGADPLTRETWQRMLERSSARPAGVEPQEWIAGDGGADRPEDPAERALPLTWNEFARDLTRLASAGHRLAPCRVKATEHEARCKSELGVRRPIRSPHGLAGRPGSPTLAEACLVLADLAVDRPRPRMKR